MGKASGGTRSSNGNFNLIGGWNDAEITDNIRDYYMSNNVRSKINEISNLKTFNDLKDYFKKQGIELTTDLQSLKDKANDEIPVVRDTGQKFAIAVEIFKDTYGKDALSKLKRINMYAKDEDAKAAYYYNKKGEKDPLAGTIQTRDFFIDGRQILHEITHAFQDSKAKKGEDAVTFSERLMKDTGANFKSYFGARTSDLAAEQMADAISYGFHQGKKKNIDFIKTIRKYLK